ncbi:response regulator transcription factor [Acerihabitans arboris]|uniref:Response regulator n=1 Tax=Acerihabitans arboris TaxID=2691583 RepID=A0A845SHK4_9GAMM|nr:response regulator transcription factor [Acerihabitans arboris]NDL62101.1 response regulator [Acerihabitans arboris]
MTTPYALVVDDHPLMAHGIVEFLLTHCGYDKVQVTKNGKSCLEHIIGFGCPQLMVVDFWLPDGIALNLLRDISNRSPNTLLLVISGDENSLIQQQIRKAGAHGFVHKQDSPHIFFQAVTALQNRKLWFPDDGLQTIAPLVKSTTQTLGLTPRQSQVLEMMLSGSSNKRIALTFGISEATIKEHVGGILSKLGVTNRVEALTLLHGRSLK